MADGGFGRTMGPTLFYSAGDDDFAFSGEGRGFGSDSFSGGGGDVVLVVDGREIARAAADGLSKNRHAVRIVAKNVKPALGSVVSVSSE
jgi:hypothetical protein